jgi:hypothetical protein
MQRSWTSHTGVGSFYSGEGWRKRTLASLLLFVSLVLVGCGGGYAGMGITSLSASTVTIDAGQSFSITAQSSATIPLTWALTGASCSGSACGTISTNGATAIYTAPASVAAPVVVTLRASVPYTQNSSTTTITVNPAPVITGNTPAGTVGIAYNTKITTSGGTGTVKLSIGSGTLPAGLTFNASTGVIGGTPITVGTSTFVLQALDQSDVPFTVTANRSITIGTASIALSASGTPPAGTVGVAYTSSLQASGGTAPYTWSVASGTLPAGLSLSNAGTITGTPTTAGTSMVTAQVQDAAGNKATVSFALVINGAASVLGISSPPAAIVNQPYSGTIPVSGGTGPYSCTISSGALPAGLVLGANCQITGTPTTAGPTTVTVQVTDSSSPTNTGSGPVVITVNAGASTLTAGGNPGTGVIGVPYSATLVASGGTTPYTWTISSGSLPAGLALSTAGVISGTPTATGVSTFTAMVQDATNATASVTLSITITTAGATVTITTSQLPNGTVGTPYSATVGAAGGTAPYTCGIVSGSLPAGLAFGAGCAVTGTPTIAGTSTPIIRVTDSSNPITAATGPITIVINPVGATITIASPPVATVNVPYTGTIPVTGGTGPYTCVITAGTLPAGLTLNSSNCQVTGTPTTAGPATVTVKATDSSSPAQTGTGPVTLTVNAATTTLTLGTPSAATVSTPYTGSIPVTGGTAPYACTINSGTLPVGLTLGAHCAITGTPTTAGSSTVNVTATDSATPVNTTTGPVVVTVNPIPKLTLTGVLPNATLNVAYTQTLHASGGLAPYTYAITAGALPGGITLSAGGVISGTPTAVGASSFTVTATDSEGTPQTASLSLVLLVVYPTTPNDGLLKGPYAYLFQGYDDVIAGVLAYQTASAASFTSDGAGVLSSGEIDSNHQGSTPTGNTIASSGFLGTYTLGADGRGSMAITTLNLDGTTASTITYSIALKLPTAPATVATSGSLIESDGNIILSTKGSGTLLAQTTSAFATGLQGNYAFGLSGDTPCLPSCTIALTPGPVVSVGQFTAAGGAIAGKGDANVASDNYANSTLGGSYLQADGNGRVQLSLTTSGLTGKPFPTDYAVYVVDAAHAFLLSTDKHSSFVLQAGTATAQSQTNFTNGSMGAPFVGYENAAVNPGLVGSTLSNVLNLSSATVFRGKGNGNGTCSTTNVDVGGVSGLVNSLTGLLGSILNLGQLNALLGSYQTLGSSNCIVEDNGRVTYNYPAPPPPLLGILGPILGGTPTPPTRVAYLTSPNTGYFLETGYAGLGMLAAQTGAPFSLSTLNGTFLYSTVPASTLATINSTGSFTADGAGHATSTLDLNVGVGNLNILQLGVAGSDTYSLTDATAGRYLLGGTRVIYAIAPGRFVLLETNPLSTSPYIALLY